MTRQEYLFVVLGEELAETQKEIAKALRFGPESHCPGTYATHAERIQIEFNECVALMEMLGSVVRKTSEDDLESRRQAKKAAVDRLWGLSEEGA